ncbi:MAG TPA: hypothetical protein GX701_00480 [Clostridiales bacterium]|nr:hypothetical protein [Clostridiales bacterium]
MEIIIKPGFLLMLAASVFSLGIEVTLALILSMVLHEVGHAVALFAFGGRVESLSMTMGGLSMEPYFPKLPSYGQEMVCVASGPAVSLLAGLAFAFLAKENAAFYLLSGVNFSLGIFNLIPVSGFDGGRLFSLMLEQLAGPTIVAPYILAADLLAAFFLVYLGVVLFFRSGRNYALLLSLLYPAGLAVSKIKNSPSSAQFYNDS